MDIEEQRREIETLRDQVYEGAGSRDTAQLKDRLLRLEKNNDELRLHLASLVRYLGHKGVLQQDEFRSLVEAVDVEDGRADGGYRGSVVK